MKILVTNDDGISHPGLLALVNAVKPLGDVTVLAPDRNWSASGHVKTLHRPLRVKATQLPDGTPAHMSDGAPSDCIALALLGYFDHSFDLVVSGINPYANIGDDVTYSGTVTAAMEAAIGGLPRHTLLNVNIPYLPLEQIKGVQVTRLGLRVYRDELVRRTDPQHNPYYWIGGEAPTGQPDEGTEVGALQAGYVSVTPLQMDMTAHHLIPELATWQW